MQTWTLVNACTLTSVNSLKGVTLELKGKGQGKGIVFQFLKTGIFSQIFNIHVIGYIICKIKMHGQIQF